MDRVERWYKRIQEDQNHQDEIDADIQLDNIYAFFHNLYHLKDWVKADEKKFGVKRNKSLGTQLERLFDKDVGVKSMKVCSDLVNGLKHVVLNNYRLDPETGVKKSTITKSIRLEYVVKGQSDTPSKDQQPSINRRFIVTCLNVKYDIFDLARDCYKEINKFFKDVHK